MRSPLDDVNRLESLSSSNLLDSAPELRFDRLTRLLCKALRTPVALISLVDDRRQFFKSQVGLPEPWSLVRETPLSHSFCQHVVLSANPLKVRDARLDPLVCRNAAIDDLNVIAYLGMPIRDASGQVLGSLCAIDSVPRDWNADDEATAADVAALVEEQIRATDSEQRWRTILGAVPQMVWSSRPDGYVDFYNDRWYEFTGLSKGATDGEAWREVVHPDDRVMTWSRWRNALECGEPYEVEYRLRCNTGEYRWCLGRALPILDPRGAIERWFGTCTDINTLKEIEAQRDILQRELAHRIQNVFAVTTGLIGMAARSQPGTREFADSLAARVRALAAANRYVIADCGVGAADRPDTLHALAAAIMKPYRGGADSVSNIVIEGQDLELRERGEMTSFALVIHEFVTNSLKYGSLSKEGGSVAILTEHLGDRFRLTWREKCGPEITAIPQRCGFGSKLVDAMLKQLRGRIERRWERSGLEASLEIDLTSPGGGSNHPAASSRSAPVALR